MSKKVFINKVFSKAHEKEIARANRILAEYAPQGLVLTLRQLYYQFVARGFIPNEDRQYKRLGGIVGDARLAGRIDWDSIEDRSRNLRTLQNFTDAQDALNKLAQWYHVDMWKNQSWRPEVWIEKDALSGVIAGVCEENDVPYFSCRGYTSLSEMYGASCRLKGHLSAGQRPYIIHFGDHDPSGMDMSRDIYVRLNATFMAECEFKRVALTMDQVEEYNPPPNPAKVTDSRYKVYLQEYGDESWELDALNPSKFRELIELELFSLRSQPEWNKDVKEKARVKKSLVELADDWESVASNKRKVKKLEGELAMVIRDTRVDADKAKIEIDALRNELKRLRAKR